MPARLIEKTTSRHKMPLALGAATYFLFLITLLFTFVVLVFGYIFFCGAFPAVHKGAGTLGSALAIFAMMLLTLGASLCSMTCNWIVDLLRHRGLPEKFETPKHPLRALAQPLLVLSTLASGWAVVAGIFGKILQWDSSWAWLALWIPSLIVSWVGLCKVQRQVRTLEKAEMPHPFTVH